MPNICQNYVRIGGPEEVLVALAAREFHWAAWFKEVPEEAQVRMATARGDDAPPIHLQRCAEGGIEAFFISAWCPPLEFYNRLLEEFKDIRIEYEYHEWQMAFAGFGVAGRGMEPTHYSYESAEDIELMKRDHKWRLEISNPHFEEGEETIYSTDEEGASAGK